MTHSNHIDLTERYHIEYTITPTNQDICEVLFMEQTLPIVRRNESKLISAYSVDWLHTDLHFENCSELFQVQI